MNSVWLSGAISQREIAANSTYWEAKVRKDGLEDGTGFRMAKKGGFDINRNPGQSPKNQSRDIQSDLLNSGSDWPIRRVIWPSIGKKEHLILAIPQFNLCLAIGG
jgi:hypothetical protein